mgnify:CR=1 FL=1
MINTQQKIGRYVLKNVEYSKLLFRLWVISLTGQGDVSFLWSSHTSSYVIKLERNDLPQKSEDERSETSLRHSAAGHTNRRDWRAYDPCGKCFCQGFQKFVIGVLFLVFDLGHMIRRTKLCVQGRFYLLQALIYQRIPGQRVDWSDVRRQPRMQDLCVRFLLITTHHN